MIAGLDSAFPPSPYAAKRAKAGGVSLWNGYLSTAKYDGGSHFGLYHPWPAEGFDYARLCGSTPIAFCSGWDNPVALKALAASLDVRLCLDIESGIRADGSWKQAWLDASGAGLYGNYGCHNCRAAFHVLAAYPGSGDVKATWWSASVRPATPCGWQWAGTHGEFGVSVDRGDYDDWFGGLHGGGGGTVTGDDMNDQEHNWLEALVGSTAIRNPVTQDQVRSIVAAAIATAVTDLKTAISAVPPGTGAPADLAPVLNAIAGSKVVLDGAASDIASVRMRVEKDLAP